MYKPRLEQVPPPLDPNVQKVQLEIADLRWKVGRTYKIAQMVSIISALVAIFALVMGLRQFNDQQEREVKKPIREKQLTLEFELSDVASRIATLPPDDIERKKAESRFRELYWGPIAYAEDRELLKWIVDFGNCLDDYDRARKLGRDHHVREPVGGSLHRRPASRRCPARGQRPDPGRGPPRRARRGRGRALTPLQRLRKDPPPCQDCSEVSPAPP